MGQERKLKWVLLGVIPLSLSTLSGCAALGDSSYSCKGMPEGVKCKSTREVYREQVGASLPEEQEEAVERAQRQRSERLAGRSFGPGPLQELPRPVRTPAQVMRVWHAPFEDQRGDLHMGGFSFTEVETRRWNFGAPSTESSGGRMLEVPERQAPAEETPSPSGGR